MQEAPILSQAHRRFHASPRSQTSNMIQTILMPIKLYLILQTLTQSFAHLLNVPNQSDHNSTLGFVPLLYPPANHRMEPVEKAHDEIQTRVSPFVNREQNEIDSDRFNNDFFTLSDQNLFAPKHMIPETYKQINDSQQLVDNKARQSQQPQQASPRWSVSYNDQTQPGRDIDPPSLSFKGRLRPNDSTAEGLESVAFDDDHQSDLSSFPSNRLNMEDSGSMSLSQAQKALSDNLDLQNKLLSLLNRAKSVTTAAATTTTISPQVATDESLNQQQPLTLLQQEQPNLISLRQSDQLMRGIVPANNFVQHPKRNSIRQSTSQAGAGAGAASLNIKGKNNLLIGAKNHNNHHTPTKLTTTGKLASLSSLASKDEPLLTIHEDQQVQQQATPDYVAGILSQDDDISMSRLSAFIRANKQPKSSRPMTPNLIKDLQYVSNPQPPVTQSGRPPKVAPIATLTADKFGRVDEYPIKLMNSNNNIKHNRHYNPGPLLLQQRRRVNQYIANNNQNGATDTLNTNYYELASSNQNQRMINSNARHLDDLNLIDYASNDSDNQSDDLDAGPQVQFHKMAQGYSPKSFYEDNDEGRSLSPLPVEPRKPNQHWSVQEPDVSGSEAKRLRRPQRRPNKRLPPKHHHHMEGRSRNRQLIEASWYSPLVASSFVESGELRDGSPSHQVVHIHSKEKKGHGKYLWPIVGGGLTMLMGFLIISNMLLSIPLLAIGASSLFNHSPTYSQQLVPVYNLSQIATTRAPAGRRKKRAAGTQTRVKISSPADHNNPNDTRQRWKAIGQDKPILEDLETRIERLIETIVQSNTINKAKLALGLAGSANSRLFGGLSRRQVLKAAYCRARPIRQYNPIAS